MTSLRCQATLTHHTGKVQAVAWNPADPPVLLSGGFDHRVCLVRLDQFLLLAPTVHVTAGCQVSLLRGSEPTLLLTVPCELASQQSRTTCFPARRCCHKSGRCATALLDQRIMMQADARAPVAGPLAWEVQADLEALCWAPHSPTQFVASDEAGMVTCFDARTGAPLALCE